jgi:hypothetical protein
MKVNVVLTKANIKVYNFRKKKKKKKKKKGNTEGEVCELTAKNYSIHRAAAQEKIDA